MREMSEVYSGMYLINVEDDVRLIGREVVVPPSKLKKLTNQGSGVAALLGLFTGMRCEKRWDLGS